MTTIGEQIYEPEGTPDDFQKDIEDIELRRSKLESRIAKLKGQISVEHHLAEMFDGTPAAERHDTRSMSLYRELCQVEDHLKNL